MGHYHCHRQYIDNQDAASWAMTIVTDKTIGYQSAASWAMAIVTDNTSTIRMLLNGS